MNITLITPQIPIAYRNGGIGTFTKHYLQVLVNNGQHDVTLIYTGWQEQPPEAWQPYYSKQGIKVRTVYEENKLPGMGAGYSPLVRISEIADQLIPEDADVVICADYRAAGLVAARRRKFRANKMPVLATIIHGPSAWHLQGQRQWPSTYDDLAGTFFEQYMTEHSDIVAAPSQYSIDWARGNGWRLPPGERIFVLKYPWTPGPDYVAEPAEPPAAAFKRMVYFGRIETRKGIDLFVDALLTLKGDPCLAGLEADHPYSSLAELAAMLEVEIGIPVNLQTELESDEAQQFLRQRATDTLVVAPSRAETFGYTIIECSLIPGLNLIFADAGGTREVLDGEAAAQQMFAPTVPALRAKLAEWLAHGPRPHDQLGHYQWKEANWRWGNFTQKLADYTAEYKPKAYTPPVIPTMDNKPVDVVVTNYNLGRYLPYALQSLARQTTNDFNVFIIDDGSSDSDTIATLDAMEARYQDCGWHFIRQENQGVCAARNLGALLGNAEYILYMDADNVAAPNMVERFLEAIRLSGDDCLTSWMYIFEGEQSPYTGVFGTSPLLPPKLVYLPVGNHPALNIITNAYGDLNCIMRRSALEAVGGFTMDYPTYINREDHELFTALSLAGYKMDVIPEFLFYYRYRETSRLRSTDHYQNEARVMRVYRQKLAPLGLGDIADLSAGLNYSLRAAEQEISRLQYMVTAYQQAKYVGDDGLVTFDTKMDYLTNGVIWWQLISAMGHKVAKNLRRRT